MLVVVLAIAAVSDIRAHRIPNWLTLTGTILGLIGHAWLGGWPGLIGSLEGIGIAGLLLLPYAVRGLGAGDVKLLAAVGALMGPAFLLWTLLGTILAGGLLALAGAVQQGRMRGVKMPLAPAIALGALFSGLHGRLLL